jgi:hypothetical protein
MACPTDSFNELFTTQILPNRKGLATKTRASHKQNFAQMPSANISGPKYNGNYGKPGYYARTQEREDTNAGHHRYGVTLAEGGRGQQYLYDKARATIKDTTPHNRNYGHVHQAEGGRQQVYLYDKARATIKDTTPHNRNYGHVHQAEGKRHQQYLMDKARSTVRQTTHVRDYAGISAPGDHERARSRTAEENALVTDLKEVTLKRDRMAGPQRYRIVNGVQSVNMILKNKESYGWGLHTDENGLDFKDPRFHKNRVPVNTQIWETPKGKEFYNLTTMNTNRPQNQERGPECYQIAALPQNPFNISIAQGARNGSLFY